MQSKIQVRAARAGDKGTILAFCQNTFSWGDYISEAWDNWLTDPGGRMFVGLVNGQPVGVVHVAVLENGVAWMEGMRVHPEYRRQGIGTAMDAAGREYARAHGCQIARLATSIKNVTAQATLSKHGYVRIARFNEWEAKAARKKLARIATPDAVASIFTRWHDSPANAASRLIPSRDWRWINLSARRLSEQIEMGEVRVAEHGFALLLAFDEKDGSGLAVRALEGEAETLRRLALAARGEAAFRGYPRVDAMLFDRPDVNAALQDAGYLREGGMFIYEQEL